MVGVKNFFEKLSEEARLEVSPIFLDSICEEIEKFEKSMKSNLFSSVKNAQAYSINKYKYHNKF